MLNIVLLALVALVFARLEFRFDFSSFLLAPARERIVSVSRLAALQLPDTPPQQWTKLMQQYSSKYPARFYVFRFDGTQLAGEPVQLPPAFLNELKRDPFTHPPVNAHDRPARPLFRGPPEAEPRSFGSPPRSFSGLPPPDGPRHGSLPDAPLEVLRTSGPTQYWVGVRIPIWKPELDDPVHAILVWRFNSLWTEPFYFNPKPWAAVIGVVLVISAVCWIPLVRGLTRAISHLTAATRRIAEGHFDIQIPAKRRDELGLLADSINRMSARLSGYVHGQKRFLGDIAHELSSPLARMQMALGILEHRATEDSAGYVADLREDVDYMSTLVSELLSFSKAGVARQAIALQPVSVSGVLSRVVNREGSRQVTIQQFVEEDLTVAGDPEYLFRALANILRNAVRYAGDAGPIEISAQRKKDRVQIAIADHGPGIAEAELENVFRPFYRPDYARTRETGSTGLGLAIVRDCVEACGGYVECRNRVPHGLEVVIELVSARAETPVIS